VTSIGYRNNKFLMAQASELMVAQLVKFLMHHHMAQGLCLSEFLVAQVPFSSRAPGYSLFECGRCHCRFQLYKLRAALKDVVSSVYPLWFIQGTQIVGWPSAKELSEEVTVSM
jgi:hypothetical protein